MFLIKNTAFTEKLRECSLRRRGIETPLGAILAYQLIKYQYLLFVIKLREKKTNSSVLMKDLDDKRYQ